MKRTLFLLCALYGLNLNAQVPTCVRDSSIIASGALLSPAPYSPSAPYYNLNDACIDHFYTQSVTVNVPDNFQSIPVTKVSIATTGAISDMPVGLTYACDPPNCEFPAKSLGCIVLYGTPTSANAAPDTFDLGITATVYTALGPIQLQFPGQVAPGSHYYLALKTADCLAGTYDAGNQLSMLANAPNPFTGQTQISAESLVSGDFQFVVYDMLGHRVHTQTLRITVGHNDFTFDAGSLPRGTYYYTLGNNNGVATRRLVIGE